MHISTQHSIPEQNLSGGMEERPLSEMRNGQEIAKSKAEVRPGAELPPDNPNGKEDNSSKKS